MIQEVTYYVCAVCNRCLYRRSVVHFKVEKYVIDTINIYPKLINSDGNFYLCHTCHKKLDIHKKLEIHAQAVCNKLDIVDVPDDLYNLNILVTVIISRRILLKKVTIMSKCQVSKLGSVCKFL